MGISTPMLAGASLHGVHVPFTAIGNDEVGEGVPSAFILLMAAGYHFGIEE